MNQVITKTHHEHFGYHNGKAIFVFRLTNIHGNYIELTNYGAIVKSIVVPDKNGHRNNVVLGYPTLKGYLADRAYIGATIGRFANRIANAQFSIDDQHYQLHKNDGINNNHSGFSGFNNKVFDFVLGYDNVAFLLDSPDGEGGFPGNLKVKVVYKWTDANEFIIEYFAETDKPTPVNFTNHAYFNLSGRDETIHRHKLQIEADSMLESTPQYIPTGKIIQISMQGFHGQALSDVMKDGGLNNFYIFNDNIPKNNPVCILSDDVSGRVMKVFTTYPGVQLYTGDFLDSADEGHNGKQYKPFDGLCLECQFYPDSPNHANFPDIILQPGHTYKHTITYAFDIKS